MEHAKNNCIVFAFFQIHRLYYFQRNNTRKTRNKNKEKVGGKKYVEKND